MITFDSLILFIYAAIIVLAFAAHIILKIYDKDCKICLTTVVVICMIIGGMVIPMIPTPVAQPVLEHDIMLTKDVTCYNSEGDIIGTFKSGTIVSRIGITEDFWNWSVVMDAGEVFCVKTSDLKDCFGFYDGEEIPLSEVKIQYI